MKYIILFSLTILFFLAIIFIGIPRQEKMECLKWKEYSEIYPDWYATEWQKAQCLKYNIEL